MTISATATEFIITGPEPSILSVLIDGVLYDTFNSSNNAPIANAGADQSNIEAGAEVTLNGTASSDADNDTLTYLWTPPVGITLSSNTVAQPTFTAPTTNANQTLTFSLVVNDGAVNSAADTVDVEVLAEAITNTAPTIAPISTQNVSAGAAVTITAIGSDGENDTLTYTFRQISGTSITLSGTGNMRTFTAPSDANTHSIVIGVIANDGELDSAEVTTTVNVAAQEPSQEFSSAVQVRIQGIPDGSYSGLFSNPTSGERIALRTLNFVEELAVTTLPVDFGTAYNLTIVTQTHVAGTSGVTS